MIAVCVAAGLGAMAVWVPQMVIAVGVAVGVGTLLVQILMWTDRDGETPNAEPTTHRIDIPPL